MTRGPTTKNQVSEDKERRFITKEFADVLAGKTPSPYFRLHDPAQNMLVERWDSLRDQPMAEVIYIERMIHFWREVSLAGLPRSGRGMDECYALMFETAFDLAEAEPEWAAEYLEQESKLEWPWESLKRLARCAIGCRVNHTSLVDAFASLYAPAREREPQWNNDGCVVGMGRGWFSAALLCAVRVSEDHALWDFRVALSSSSSRRWDDQRLHTRLIREAPLRARTTARIELMEHPILRIARLKYAEGSVEQNLVIRFLNQRCIVQRFESETDYFSGDLTLALWVRDARSWATELLRKNPDTCAAMFETCGAEAIEAVRRLFRTEISPRPEQTDHLDATAALMRWAKRRRGFECSHYRAQLWEFVVEIVDAALWLGWLFPQKQRVAKKRAV
jgi:hypothetical protein